MWVSMALLAAAAFVLLMWHLIRRSIPTGFREVVKNPAFFQKMVAAAQAARKGPPVNLSDRDIEREILSLLEDPHPLFTQTWLPEAGPRAVPHLLPVLQDARFLAPSKNEFRLNAPAVTKVIHILGEIGDERAIEPVSALIADENDEIRKEAALCLATIANNSCAVPLAAALRDDDEYVRCYVVMGLDRAIAAGKSVIHLGGALFEPLLKSLRMGSNDFEGKQVRMLIHFDRKRALRELQEGGYLTAKNEEVGNILRGLDAAKVQLPSEVLLRLEEEFTALEAGYLREFGTGEVLVAMARKRLPGIEEKARAALSSDSEQVRDRASDALALLRGVDNPIMYVLRKEQAVGWDGMTDAQQYAYAAEILVSEVNNGGIRQYFFNSSGDRWRIALQALKEFGLPQMAALIKRAVDLFGPEGPNQDRQIRQNQLAKVSKRHDAELDAVDTEFYEINHEFHPRLVLFAADRPDEFAD